MNMAVALILEVPHFQLADLQNVGYFVLLANAMVAFGLNVSVVFLVRLIPSIIQHACRH
jgi:hypothetical protein